MVTIKGNTLINKGLLVDACGEGHYMSSTLYIMSSLLYKGGACAYACARAQAHVCVCVVYIPRARA